MTPATAPAGTGTATAVGMLEALGTELGALGLAARLRIQAGEVPVLHVTSPAGPALAEDIRAACQDRAWLFWWSWGCATRRCYSEWRWKTIHRHAVAAAG